MKTRMTLDITGQKLHGFSRRRSLQTAAAGGMSAMALPCLSHAGDRPGTDGVRPGDGCRSLQTIRGDLPLKGKRTRKCQMTIRKIEMERLTVISSKSFETVVAAVEGAIGRPDMVEFGKASRAAATNAEFEDLVQRSVSAIGLMLFLKLDIGGVLRRESGGAKPKAERLIIGNPLIMREMVKHVPEAAINAPVTLLVDERSDGVHLSYDRMASLLAPYGNNAALAVARDLDAKIERLMEDAAG
jgi:uncharacterized protein (DUF302 family)